MSATTSGCRRTAFAARCRPAGGSVSRVLGAASACGSHGSSPATGPSSPGWWPWPRQPTQRHCRSACEPARWCCQALPAGLAEHARPRTEHRILVLIERLQRGAVLEHLEDELARRLVRRLGNEVGKVDQAIGVDGAAFHLGQRAGLEEKPAVRPVRELALLYLDQPKVSAFVEVRWVDLELAVVLVQAPVDAVMQGLGEAQLTDRIGRQ